MASRAATNDQHQAQTNESSIPLQDLSNRFAFRRQGETASVLSKFPSFDRNDYVGNDGAAAFAEYDGDLAILIRNGQLQLDADIHANAQVSQGETHPQLANHLTGLKLVFLTLGLCLTSLTVALDVSIIATAIPKITADFKSMEDVAWYGSSYLLGVTALQPLFGKLYKYFSTKWIYLTALVVFEIGSIICAAAKSSAMLIIGRSIAGCAASALYCGGLTIIGDSVEPRKQPAYIAAISSGFAIANIVGPLLGGVFTDKATWRWCFWINLPTGFLAFIAVFFLFKPKQNLDQQPVTILDKIPLLDLEGAFVLAAGVICLLLALQWGGSRYAWSDAHVWGCLIGFGLLLAAFVAIQAYKGDKGTIPTRFLHERTICACCVFGFFNAMVYNIHVYHLPLYFQAIKNSSAEASGVRTIPYLGAMIVGTVLNAIMLRWRAYYKYYAILASVFLIAGALLICGLDINTSTAAWVMYQVCAGAGVGLGLQIPFLAIPAALEQSEGPTAYAVAVFFGSMGGAIGISGAQSIFANSLRQILAEVVPSVAFQQIMAGGAAAFRQGVAEADLPYVLAAYNHALDNAFVLPVAASVATAFAAVLIKNAVDSNAA